MHVNIANTYACRNATKISKPVSATEKPSGSHPPTIPRLTTKPPNTFIIVCPAIILANNLTERLIGLLKYEIISMTTINGNKTIGTPLGTNSFKYPNLCLIKPIIVTPIKINPAKTKVTIMWLVTVKVYGIIPNMLQNKTNMNSENINEKYGLAFVPAVSLIILDINE